MLKRPRGAAAVRDAVEDDNAAAAKDAAEGDNAPTEIGLLAMGVVVVACEGVAARLATHAAALMTPKNFFISILCAPLRENRAVPVTYRRA
ncbi:MAG: hypothetical protein M3423_05475 [Actinomycetota bacterium]|nr:hypothetical protein [Actinomycetota bacterium]